MMSNCPPAVLMPCVTSQEAIVIAIESNIAVCQVCGRCPSERAASATWMASSAPAKPVRTTSGAWLYANTYAY